MRQLRDLVRRLLGKPGTRRLLVGVSMATAAFLCGVNVANASEAAHVFKVFKEADQNKNAGLDPHEFPQVLEPLHEHIAEGELAAVFASIDHDKSGLLEFEELLHWIERPNYWAWSNTKPPTGWFWVDFFIFVFVLVYFTKKPVQAMFKNRHETVKKNLADAQAAHEKALGHREEYRDKLARVDEEAKSLISGAKEDGATARERIIAASKAYAERLRTDAVAAAEQEVRFSHRRLRDEVAFEVLRETRSMLEGQLNADDHQRLIDQAITDIEGGKGDLVQAFESASQGGTP